MINDAFVVKVPVVYESCMPFAKMTSQDPCGTHKPLVPYHFACLLSESERAYRSAKSKEIEIMAVPKRKMGRARTHARRSTNDKIAAPSRSVCPQCGEAKLPHRVCPNCGFYKNREVIETD